MRPSLIGIAASRSATQTVTGPDRGQRQVPVPLGGVDLLGDRGTVESPSGARREGVRRRHSEPGLR